MSTASNREYVGSHFSLDNKKSLLYSLLMSVKSTKLLGWLLIIISVLGMFIVLQKFVDLVIAPWDRPSQFEVVMLIFVDFAMLIGGYFLANKR